MEKQYVYNCLYIHIYVYYVPCKLVGPLQGNLFSNHVFFCCRPSSETAVLHPPHFQPMLNEGFRKCGYPQIIRKLDHHYPWLSIKTHGFGLYFQTQRYKTHMRCSKMFYHIARLGSHRLRESRSFCLNHLESRAWQFWFQGPAWSPNDREAQSRHRSAESLFYFCLR